EANDGNGRASKPAHYFFYAEQARHAQGMGWCFFSPKRGTQEHLFSKAWKGGGRVFPEVGKSRGKFSKPWKKSAELFQGLEKRRTKSIWTPWTRWTAWTSMRAGLPPACVKTLLDLEIVDLFAAAYFPIVL
ncbi:MAG: hypothetical protein NTY53_23475, partial [Kiritimatiellaeota bacterium]|nr:hypothetical protein [Kiritimatiellota bacterium]